MKPILVVSDSPDCSSGLARAGRDIALRLHQAGAEVGYCGYWGHGVHKGEPPLPYPFLAAGPDPTKHLIPITLAADEFFGNDPGVVLFLYDPTWLVPFGGGDAVPEAGWENIAVQAWARRRGERGVELWGAFPVDAHCPSGKLPSITCNLLQSFDRVAGWTNYGARVLGHSILRPETEGWGVPVLPLGMDPRWQEGDAVRGRNLLDVPNSPILGVVGTNQPRKDWGLAFQAFSLMPSDWLLWAHCEKPHDYWNLPQLVEEFQLKSRVRITRSLPDPQLADCYAACAVTFAHGRGEGFGYPILESQLAGTPCVAIDYAGGAELTPNLVVPEFLRPEGPYSFLRPVCHPEMVSHRLTGPMALGEPECWLWDAVWPAWESWFRSGEILGP